MSRHAGKTSVFFLAAEAVPFIKVGGLGDVAGALPLALHQIYALGGEPFLLDIRVAIPYHPQIDQAYKQSSPVAKFTVASKYTNHLVRVFSTIISGVVFYLIDSEIINRSPSVYSLTTSEDGTKFTLFALSALKLLKFIGWNPDILHVNDWHTALAAYLNDQAGLEKIAHSVLTLHNLPFMGAGTEESIADFNIPPSPNPDLPEWGKSHPLPMGLSTTDQIIPVSPQYALEIQTAKFGCGLNQFLKKNHEKITGILNGIDTSVWNPQTDPLVPSNFDLINLPAKKRNKIALQRELNLPEEDVPLLILISRMDMQKGIDIAIQSLREMGGASWQAVLLGSGDPKLEKACRSLEKRYKRRVRAILKFDSDLSHRMYAGGDLLIMPSRYEPCGLSQMIAMRYGCIPLATSTGGLRNTIINSPLSRKTGYLVHHPRVEDFIRGLDSAIDDYANLERWAGIQRNAMAADFSWEKSALAYAQIYQALISQIG